MIPAVIISHARAHRAVAAEIDLVLRQNGAQIFWINESWAARINCRPTAKRIENCSSFLMLWSVWAASSIWAKTEWHLAYTKQKRISPIIVDGFALPGTRATARPPPGASRPRVWQSAPAFAGAIGPAMKWSNTQK